MSTTTLHKSACNLCSLNCGIEIELNPETREFVKITGDKEHPLSQGYICQKATRINYYQNHKQRLTAPLKKQNDGSFKEISWDVAIQEIADQLVSIRDTHGGETIAYAGGGGQGNHLGGIYAASLRAACKTPYIYSSLAQEKTGNFWVHGKMFGRQNTMYAEPVEDAEYVLIIGANPMQSHGIQKARRVIGELSRDPNRTLVVIDPRETETAKKADLFLQVKPGKDAWLMAAILGFLAQKDLVNHSFIQEHTNGYAELLTHLMKIPIAEYAAISGIPLSQIEQVAHGIASAKTMSLRSDLGIEMSYNSTLNAYLARLIFLITGHFGKHGTNHLTTWFFPLLGHSKDPEEGGLTTAVTKTRGIGKLFPPNILPLEIDSDHPKHIRGLIVDSANPVSSWADTQAQIKAYKTLDLMVVIDVAMTETAKEAHYVLPAASQYEKVESTFFQENFFHLRQPVLEPLEGTLTEPEIYSRIVRAMNAVPASFSELKEAAQLEKTENKKGHFQQSFMKVAFTEPSVKRHGVIALKESIGETLPKGMEAAGPIWMTAQMYANKYPEAIKRAGIEGNSAELGENLFKAILDNPSGIKVSERAYENHWALVKHKDNKVQLFIPELLQWLDDLPLTLEHIKQSEIDFPFNLIAGERRTYNANTIIRNPEWRKKDAAGKLKINPSDAAAHGINDGDAVQLESSTGSVKIISMISDEVPSGVLSMPHGHGLKYYDQDNHETVGAMANLLTSTDHCDPLAKTPYHKNVRVRMSKV